MATSTVSLPSGLSHKRDNLYMFVDWANAYREARKLHNPELFPTPIPNETTVTPSVSEQGTPVAQPVPQPSDAVVSKESTTTEEMHEENKPTLENLLAELVNGWKKYDNTGLGTDKGVENLFKLIECVNQNQLQVNMENLLKYQSKLNNTEERKAFLEQYLLPDQVRSNDTSFDFDHAIRLCILQDDAKHPYVLWSNFLQLVCCQWDQYRPLPKKENCFIFLSYRPGRRDAVTSNKLYARMIKKFNVLLYERITTSLEQKVRLELGKEETVEVIIKEKEKGVDVGISVHIIDIIRRSVEREENKSTHIVLVSSDSDFKPVIEYAIENGVCIDVWAWEGSVSAIYERFLQSAGEKVRLFYLNRYLYQIGYVVQLKFKYEVLFMETADTEKLNVSHFTLAECLTRSSNFLKQCDKEYKKFTLRKQDLQAFVKEEDATNTKELSILKSKAQFFPPDDSLFSAEETAIKDRIRQLQSPQRTLLEAQKEIKRLADAIEQNRKKRKEFETEWENAEENGEMFQCQTSDFTMRWNQYKASFIIAFYSQNKRSAFLAYRETSQDPFAELLRKFPVETREKGEQELRHELERRRRERQDSENLCREAEESVKDDDDISFSIMSEVLAESA